MAYTTFKDTRDNISLFYAPITMPGNYVFNHSDTIKLIDLYYNGKFKSGSFDSRGFRKFFYNIVKPACDIASKFIDLDTKDIILIPDGNGMEEKIFIMQRDLKQWLKEQDFGKLLNDIGFDYPKYGHIFLKKSKNGWKKVNIHNLRFDPASQSFETDTFFYEALLMTRREIEDMDWDKEEIKKLISSRAPVYLIYECYDYCDNGWKRSFRGRVWTREVNGKLVESPEAIINNQNDDYKDGYILYEDEVKELPYRELKWENVPGRRMGIGYVEYLFDNQIRMNELVNIKAKGLHYTSLKLFQTRDDTVGRNVLTDAENGDIIKTTDEIKPVPMEERNLAPFQYEEARWDSNTEQKTFSFDIARGENLPSRTPLGVANLSAGMVASYFELKRENFGLFIKKLLLDDILPSFEKISEKEHKLTFLGSDEEIERFDAIVANLLSNAALSKYILETGFMPDPLEMESQKQAVIQNLKSKKHRYLDLPKGFYVNAKYSIDVLITGEQVDSGAKIQTLQMVLQIIGTNPAVIQDATTRKVLFKMLSYAGINPEELNLSTSQPPQQIMPQMPVAGSMAGMPQQAPQMANSIQQI